MTNKLRPFIKYPDLKLPFQKDFLRFKFLGSFDIEKDKDGCPYVLVGNGEREKNYLLSIRTALTKSCKVETITVTPEALRERLNRRYYHRNRLKDIWRMPGIYAFVLIKNNRMIKNPKYKYVGRASNTIVQRLQGYLVPGPTQSTNEHVNHQIFSSLEKGVRTLIYFFPELDTEKELHRSLQPEWNKDIPRTDF